MSRPTPRSARRTLALLVSGALAASLPVACSSSPQATDPYHAATPGTATTAPTEQPKVGTTSLRSIGDAEAALVDGEQQLDKLIGTEPQATALSTDACSTVCKVLASIKNAAAHVCSLSTDDPARCESAKGRAERAEERAKSVCPSCADSD